MPLFLENTADIWYGELNPAPATFEQFRQALLRTFETTGSTFVDEQTFARYAQKPSESVALYYARIKTAGEKHNITPTKRLSHYLGSLLPKIKVQVLTHNPPTLAHALEMAHVAEQAIIPAHPTKEHMSPDTLVAQLRLQLANKDWELSQLYEKQLAPQPY